jgi:dolichyl-phosphate-mannose--protein O-mannosyl transferase
VAEGFPPTPVFFVTLTSHVVIFIVYTSRLIFSILGVLILCRFVLCIMGRHIGCRVTAVAFLCCDIYNECLYLSKARASLLYIILLI